ncbi:MAG: MBL fold metallo-hydrolase [Verrucomicrobia bacterium]|nr:MBL fold metallo-hydrolase [Verrucomicrobiota bacterium]
MIHPASELENNWFTIDTIDESTFAFSEYGQWMKVHSYLFVGKEKAVLVDTGLGVGNIRTLVNAITQLPIELVTTHAHWDHTGGHQLFDNFSAHILERDWIEGGFERYSKEIAGYLVKEPFTKPPPNDFDLSKYRPYEHKVKRLHKDGDILDIGDRQLEIIHTPGHSPGHVAVYEEASGYLVTADLLYKGVLLAGLQFSNAQDYRSSLRRLRSLPKIEKLLPGHGRLEIPTDLLDEALNAFDELAEKGQLNNKGSLHTFDRLKIKL